MDVCNMFHCKESPFLDHEMRRIPILEKLVLLGDDEEEECWLRVTNTSLYTRSVLLTCKDGPVLTLFLIILHIYLILSPNPSFKLASDLRASVKSSIIRHFGFLWWKNPSLVHVIHLSTSLYSMANTIYFES
jgi:hypothetical protein